MLFSYNWLNDYLEYEITPQKLADLLGAHTFEVESVTKKDDDALLDIAVLPNRGHDCFSHQGIARETNALMRVKGDYAEKKSAQLDKISSLKTLESKEINVDPATNTPLYALAFMDDVRVSQSPDWLKERLQSVGLDPINNLVDIANYMMLDIGQPLHIFDAKTLSLPIRVRFAKDKERIALLGGMEKELTKEDVVIADAKNALAIAGIKGGISSAVSANTRSIAIEAGQFHPGFVYQTSKRLGLNTDAAKRFSVGFAPEFTSMGLLQAIALIKKLAKGENERIVKAQSKNYAAPPHVLTSVSAINQLLGLSLQEKQIRGILEALGFEIVKEKDDVVKATPPFWRQDIALPADVIEEVGRVYGLEHIPATLPRIALQENPQGDERAWRKFIRTFFVKHGFSEVYTYSLSKKGSVELQNPLSEQKKYLRESLIPGLLEAVQFNQSHRVSNAGFLMFEIGNVFNTASDGIQEKEFFAFALARPRSTNAFWELRGYVEDFLEAIGFDREDYSFNEDGHMIVDGTDVGFLGLPQIPQGMKLKGDVFVFECDLKALISQANQEREFEEPPKYPAIERDISLFLSQGTRVDEVMSLIQVIGGKLVEDVELFDIFEEENASKRSLAFHIIYRSKEKTLTDQEVKAIHKKIEDELKKQYRAEIR